MARTPCCDKRGLRKGTWTAEEDRKLISYISKHGHCNWRQLPKFAGLARCGKSCRLRWMNYLRPGMKRGNYSPQEEDTILKLHAIHGNRWSLIASHLSGRSDNDVKNHWHAHLKKRLRHNSVVTNEKVEFSIRTEHQCSQIEQKKQNDPLMEIIAATFPNSPQEANSPSSQEKSLSEIFLESSNRGNLTLDDLASSLFLESEINPITEYFGTELLCTPDIFYYFSGESLATFVNDEQEYLCSVYDCNDDLFLNSIM